MKKLILLSVLSISLVSCGAYMRGTSGANKKQLVQRVSINEDCPKENIEIINQARNRGGAVYELNVCGERMVYEQIGSVFKKSSEAEKMKESLNN